MPAGSAPPSSVCAGSTLLVQRRLSPGDCAKWRTMLRCTPRDLSTVEQIVRLARKIDPSVEWRLTLADGTPPG